MLLLIGVKAKTRSVRISLVGGNVQSCQVDSIWVNDRAVSPANLQLVVDDKSAGTSPKVDYRVQATGFRVDYAATERGEQSTKSRLDEKNGNR